MIVKGQSEDHMYKTLTECKLAGHNDSSAGHHGQLVCPTWWWSWWHRWWSWLSWYWWHCKWSLGTPPPPKNGIFWEFYPKGDLLNSQNFCKFTKFFWCAKIILRCQNMFYNSGEVISDQLNHLISIRSLENSEKNRRKQEVLGIFFFERGGGAPIPKSKCVTVIVTTKWKILWRPKMLLREAII